ncbi:hypothetical protein AMTRI_Chr04g243480 [Amborella trichopoda]
MGFFLHHNATPLLGVFAELSRLKNFQTLYLSDNVFEGAIPRLDLSWNQLQSIPSSLGNLSNQKMLDLSYNQFNETIPPILGSLSSLEALHLSENEFRGRLPQYLVNLSSLHAVYVDHNDLSDAIPPELA